MRNEQLLYLFEKYFNRTASDGETDELMEMIDNAANESDAKVLMQKVWENFDNKNEHNFPHELSESMWNEIKHKAGFTQKTPVFTLKRLAAAAMVLVICGTVVYFFGKPHKTNITVASQKHNDVAPGGNKAVLTLGDGSFIILDSALNGMLAEQGSASVSKLKNGELVYNSPKGSKTVYNGLTTPKGGHYKVTLSDGTIVWLNASSSLRFPVSFVGSKREVEMTGEAYFEVAKNSRQPFIVKLHNGSNIEVLGTHFNVMAYSDEGEAKTTLLEGAVKINKGSASNILRPGQQASIEKNGTIKIKANVNLDETTSWKNEQFTFNSTDIYTVMKQIARWYDVDIKYKGKVSASLNGNIKMNVPLSQVLEILQLAGNVKFDIMEKEIIVSQQ